MKISKNFSLEEFTKSDVAEWMKINNTNVPEHAIDNIKLLVEKILQPLRDKVNCPVRINSGYRCLKLNSAVGGVPTSQHVLGQASDIKVDGMTPFEIASVIVELDLPYDQLILYDTFCHVSYSERNRHNLLYNKNYNGRRDIRNVH